MIFLLHTVVTLTRFRCLRFGSASSQLDLKKENKMSSRRLVLQVVQVGSSVQARSSAFQLGWVEVVEVKFAAAAVCSGLVRFVLGPDQVPDPTHLGHARDGQFPHWTLPRTSPETM